MEAARFWSLVEQARAASGAHGERRIEALRNTLAELNPSELQAFQDHYDMQIRLSYRWDLWGAAYVINGGCSDDGFRYFRDWLISEGQATFEAALANPDSLAALGRIERADLELFGYVALELHQRKTGRDLDRDMSTESAEPAGDQWEEADLPRLFPKLARVYGI
jgi:hypothetical protein